MEHLILLILCCIFVGITLRDQNIGLAMSGGTLIFAVLLFINWMTPDVLSVLSHSLDRGASYVSHFRVALFR